MWVRESADESARAHSAVDFNQNFSNLSYRPTAEQTRGWKLMCDEGKENFITVACLVVAAL